MSDERCPLCGGRYDVIAWTRNPDGTQSAKLFGCEDCELQSKFWPTVRGLVEAGRAALADEFRWKNRMVDALAALPKNKEKS